ncbi:MAG: flagellar hook protein FlgE [Clostridiaceae bacterium]|jgi:flagellar hook protein FlgE|nr:flagellar hook protein FlgE [Clostridiaceae bacterium]
MMRSMFSGVSGLRAHQTRMDVIGNNVANVNTVGFKSGRVTFQEIFSQTLKGASSPDSATGRGGTNPMQIGLGLGVGAVDTITTRGSLQRTDNPTDMSIEGDGFFICKGGANDTFKFTRAGNFGIDKLGNLVTGSGLNVYGWQALKTDGSGEFDTEKPIEPINLYTDAYRNKRIISAKSTSRAQLSGNLDASMEIFTGTGTPPSEQMFSVPMTVYDSLGNDYKVDVQFWKLAATADGSEWHWEIPSSSGEYATTTASGSISFDAEGIIDPTSLPTDPVTFEPDATTGTGSFDVTLDFSKLTAFAADNSVKPQSVDGYPSGSLVSFSVGSDGILTGIYDNGQQQSLGLMAISGFENPAGLQKVGDNMYVPTTNSGDYKAVKAGSNGVGTLNPGTLEMSNVDLSKEFTEMIVTQRGFQANSRIITTSDEMLQELVSLKR